MRYPDYKYIEVAIGSVFGRNKIKRVDTYKPPTGEVDCYRTVYRYPEEFGAFYEKEKTVKGYAGPVYADYLPIDIDSEDLSEAHKNAKHLLNVLLNNYEVDLDQIRIYFSGAKGFHILLPAEMFGLQPDYYIPQAFKLVAAELSEGVEVDLAIYDRVRLLRYSNTVHSKTGLYKIPLTAAEVLHKTISEIKTMAENARTVEVEKGTGENEYLAELLRGALAKVKKTKEKKKDVGGNIRPPKNAKRCYYEILKGVDQGGRDNAGLRLAVHLLKEYPSDIVLPMLRAWNKRNVPPMEDERVDKLMRQAQGGYDYGCKDPVLQGYCAAGCVYKGRAENERVSPDRVYTMGEARNRYVEYIAKLKERKISLGFQKIDECIRGISPGEVCQYMARTGVGKTAFALNVISNVSINQNIPILFFSLEQPLAQIYERSVQISMELDGRQVERDYQDECKAIAAHTLTEQNFKNVYVVEEDFLSYEELKEFILVAEEKIGRRPPFICVDYLGRMRGGHGNAYEVTSELAKLLKSLAKEMDVAILYLHQTSRVGGTGSERLSLDMGRDSGVVEEAADFILGAWRPDINSEDAQKKDSEEMVIGVLKNRKGRLGKASYRFVKKSLRIQEWEREYCGT